MHVVQSPEWGEFKTKYGTQAIRAGNIQYTKHKVPFTNYYFAYAPKVEPFTIDFNELYKSLKENNCFTINFDAPLVLKNTTDEKRAKDIIESQRGARVAKKNTFTKYNILLDINKTEQELLNTMESKHRYNINYAKRKGVVVREGKTDEDFEIFYTLLNETGTRQKFYNHPKTYYKLIWEILGKYNIAKLLIADYKSKPLAAWMFFIYDNTLYYPYGASSDSNKNLQASSLLAWEGILLGKSFECKTFDMWGACKDPNNKQDKEWGFTNFKLRFGGNHVEYMNSYDIVLNETIYQSFHLANKVRWALLRIKK